MFPTAQPDTKRTVPGSRVLLIALAVVTVFGGLAGAVDGVGGEPGPTPAGVTLPNVFSDHAVFQRDVPVPVWGTARPGATVTVEWAPPPGPGRTGQTKTATADATGRWRVTLDPMPASSEGCTLRVRSSGDGPPLTRSDILVGDVWICAGQSNMGTTMSGAQWWMSECPGANVPAVRFLNMGGNGGYTAAEPEVDQPGRWYPCTPATSFSFSAIGYFFARQLHRELGVPVGMIKCNSWGAPAEPFVPVGALREDEMFRPLVEELEAATADFEKKESERVKAYEEKLAGYAAAMAEFAKTLAASDPGLLEFWYGPGTDVSRWGSIRLPGGWERTELQGQAGSVWFRREAFVVGSWVGRDLLIQLGGCDDKATVYFNGTEIGGSGADTDAMGYRVPAGLARAGGNTIVVRVVDSGGSPGCLGSADFLMYLSPADGGNGDERIPLPGNWKYRAGWTVARAGLPRRPSPPVAPGARQTSPGSLYNGMLAPIAGYPIKGAIWYQGESNAGRAKEYETLFPLLIDSWRRAWRQAGVPLQAPPAPVADFAFLWVQLPNFLGQGRPKDYAPPVPGAPPGDLPLGWAALREAQLETLTVPNTAMAVTIDIGETWDIHPNNKKAVADRLALAALGAVYGRDLPYSGPVYDSMTAEDGKIRLRFKHLGGGLVVRGGELREFAVAGEDRVFAWANAKIEGETVLVWSDKVTHPVAVRYAFRGDPQGANLYNAGGLPASPFRTDDWELTQ